MPAASLDVRGLSAGYGPTVVLEDVSFSVPSGARLSILGRNGMGKTTLLSTLMGMNRRYGGEIRIGGADVSGLEELGARTKGASAWFPRRGTSSAR